MSAKKNMPQGEVRQSQVVTTFGPGSMLDLPKHSVIVGGLDHWTQEGRRPVFEERLASRVCEILDVKQIDMYAPPVDSSDPGGPRTGVTAFAFPTWFVATVLDQTFSDQAKDYRTRPLVHWSKLVKGKYLTDERKSVEVVPVGFVQACVNGHVDDLDWYGFSHHKFNQNCRGQLWLDEGGTGGDLTEIYVRCSACPARRSLSEAKVPKGSTLGHCRGHRPWLGPKAREECTEENRLLVRSASNSYFPQVLSVISIPELDAAIKSAVDKVWEDELKWLDDLDEFKKLRKKGKPKVSAALEGLDDDGVWAEIERRKSPAPADKKGIKQAEIETLLAAPKEVGEDIPDTDFHARTRPVDGLPPWLLSKLDRIVLVHRLREVVAQVGFTRFEAVTPDIEGELELDVKRAALQIDPRWVPAIENRGEGIFLAFRKETIAAWMKRPDVVARGKHLEEGFDKWCSQKGATDSKFPGLPYIMLHSLSHLLITAVSLECGYAATSIRERVYGRGPEYGILLITGTSGSEGTLGGLVQVGRRIEDHLTRALEVGRLCSNDPVCAQPAPGSALEERYLHGSSCHGCLLIAETCCERRNDFLDRALVVPTVANVGAEFFEG